MAELSNIYSESEKRFLLQYIEKEKPNLSFNEIITRLNSDEPIDYILGYTYFFGLKIGVDSNTLIPRPETEELVELIIEENKQKSSPRILDIGTGSGCIALALKKHLPQAEVWAVDISDKALEKVSENSQNLGLNLTIQKMDILNPKTDVDFPKFDIIVSNPPYISKGEMSSMTSSVLNFEPHIALFVEDEDSLLFYREILRFANHHLAEKGLVYLETSQENQLEHYTRFKIEKLKDLSGNWRFLKCVLTC